MLNSENVCKIVFCFGAETESIVYSYTACDYLLTAVNETDVLIDSNNPC